MRMQTWRLASSVQAGVPRTELVALLEQFDESLALLRTGDPLRPLFVPWDDKVHGRFDAVQELWVAQRQLWLSDPPPAPPASLQAAAAFVAATEGLVLTIEQHMSRLTAILNLFQLVMMALAIGGAVVMLYTGYLYVINPLLYLRQGLLRVESGAFATRIEVDTLDEFGQVAAGFNHMAATLQSLYGGLEAQVQAKTHDIESQRARLASLYEVSAFVAQANTIESLAQGFARRVREIMGADAAAIRWSDEANQRFLMLASDCFPQDLLDEERSVPAGTCACGNLRADAPTRVIPIAVAQDAPVRRCARAGYERVVSVPVRLQQRVLGEVDLFFRGAVQLSHDETELLDALVSHLASALESLRAQALEREAAVAEERALLARELHDSIAQSLAFLKIQAQLLRRAIQREQPAKVQGALDELDAGLRESINDVRELLVHFRTRTNSDDIEQALQETLQKFQHQTSLPTQLQIQGDGLPLPPDAQVQVLHVVQEALSNVRKHARATQVELQVFKGAPWRFVVRDDGQGFDPTLRRGESHVGLNIMQERAQRIGAHVHIDSTPGQGAVVTLTLAPGEITPPLAPPVQALSPPS